LYFIEILLYERIFKETKKIDWRCWIKDIRDFSNQGDINKFYADLLKDIRLFRQKTVPQLNNEYKEILKLNF
jgi:hypothetical protein